MEFEFFWHLKIPTIDSFSLQSENQDYGIRIAILDTMIDRGQKNVDIFDRKNFNVREGFEMRSNFNSPSASRPNDQSAGSDEKNCANFKICSHFSKQPLQKNHGACVVSLIQQIVTPVEIISIPILDTCGQASKNSFLQGLRQALRAKVHILYLGLRLQNFDKKNKVDREILKLLREFEYVVAPSGNDGLSCQEIAFPARAVYFSVGAFEKKNDRYLICDFSQSESKTGPNFVMPGKDLACNEGLVSGTSMAAALMVGVLAKLLSIGGVNFTVEQMYYLIQKNSKILDRDQWKSRVIFGTPDLSKSIFCLKQLQEIRKKILDKKFNKNFQKFVDEIVVKT